MSDNLETLELDDRVHLTRYQMGNGHGHGVQITAVSTDRLAGGTIGLFSYVSVSREQAGKLGMELLRFSQGAEIVDNNP